MTALAWTRADKDASYTKLDLTDAAAVDAWFAANKVDGTCSVPQEDTSDGAMVTNAKQPWSTVPLSAAPTLPKR